ncbi:MAG: hydrolase [Clostridiales bacterium]|jgi:predicted hydrolase (HD superfamily)|nr:hydrolase [Clostridiales bacterium]
MIPKPEDAMRLVEKYNKEKFHLDHAKTVGDVLAHIAETHDPGREDYWKTVGYLHDIDFGLYPDEHCSKCVEILKTHGVNEQIIRSVQSHGYGICSDIEPEHIMEKYLYAIDELTGLIGAVALVRPSGYEGMTVKSIKKKFKDRAFAAGCSRDVISRGAEMLEISLDELISITLNAINAIK